MSLKVADRGRVPPFIVMDVMRAAFEREAKGGDVLHMEVGQPGTGAPQGVIEAARRALTADKLGYTDSFGIPPLRQAIARHYRNWYGLDVPVERIAVTTGSSGAFLIAFLSTFDPGDRVAMVEPGYPCYKNILSLVGLTPVSLPGSDANRYQPTVALLEGAEAEGGPLDGLVIASPSNPTGTMIGRGELRELVTYCQRREIRIVSDEIYHGIVYGAPAATALATSGDAIVINSFSKYFSMTGWRLGWVVLPEDLVRAGERLAQNLFISPPTLSQHAAIAAFDCHAELEANVARYARNREVLLEELPKAGFDRLAPADGAFYLYADIGHLTNNSEEFCSAMLAETGVAATPGIDFDPARGHAFMRFSFSGTTDDMAEAAKKLQGWRREASRPA